MRTPQRKREGKGGKSAKTETNKLRKKAMKNKMMKKTMLTLAGDDTKEEIRDLINDSNLSNISIIGRSPAPAAAAKKKSPGRRKKSAAATPSSDRPASQRKGLRSSVSLKSLGNGLKRKLSMEKMNQEEGGAGTTKMKLVKRDPDPMETETNGHQEEEVSRLQGVKNMLSSVVWGVPYAQVVEEEHSATANDSLSEKPSKCIIS